MPTGVLKKWFVEKGFGFITPDDSTTDLFAPKRSFQGASEADIREGAKVHFEAELEERTNKMKASKWTVLDGLGLGGATAAAGLQAQLLGGLGAAGLAGLAMPGLATPGLAAYGAIPGLATPQIGGIPGLSPYGVAGLGAMPGVSLVQTAPAVAAAPAALPPGWEQVTDPNTNRPYWCNRATGESSWTPPQADPAVAMATPGAVAATGLYAGQQAAALGMTSPAPVADGSVAFDAAAAVAAATGVAPAAVAVAPVAAATGVAPEAAAVASNGAVALPAGWEQAMDPNTNRAYYFNRSTGQTSWTVPA